MNTIGQDIRYALRTMRRNPGFALAVVLTLALGIGANVTMFSVVDALLFRMPEHVRAPEQLVRVSYTARPPLRGYRGHFPGFQSIIENAKNLDLTLHMTAEQGFGRGADAKQINVDFVSQNFFQLLGMEIQIGRPFAKDENQLDRAAPVAILSYQFWQKQFGGDRHVIGKEFWIGERQYTVIGIAPRGFNGVNSSIISAWLPVADSPAGPEGFTDTKGTLRNQFLILLGRLHGGVTTETARAETDGIYLHSGADPQFAIRVAPLFPSRIAHLSDSSRISLWLAGVSFIGLLIACANVTNLFLVRMVRRKHEMAIRLQLGAGRGRLIGQVVVESLMLAAVGGVAAIVVTAWLNPLVRGFLLPPGFYAGEFLNYRVITMTAFFAVLAGITSGIAPACRASRANLVEALKSGAQGHSSERSALRSGLLVAQVALTLVLIVGAGLFIHSLRHIQALDLGFDPDHALTARVDLRKAGFQAADINSAYLVMMERVREVSGVEAAGITSSIPLHTMAFRGFKIPADSSPTKPMGGAVFEAVTPGYFAAMGMKIVQGRDFTPTDRVGSQPVIIVNLSFAQEIWPGQNAVGKCVFYAGADQVCAEIVGVVRDAKPDMAIRMTDEKKERYAPLDQAPLDTTANTLVIRTSGKPSAAMRGILAALESVVPGSRFVNLQPLSLALDEETQSWRLGASMFSFFGALALLLAAVGIYGVLAFLVRHRTSEIGIRMALGAMPQDILRLIVWQGMKFVGLGLVIGIGAALGLSRVVRSLLFEVTPTDVWSYAGASGVLIVVALAACMVPAWRAARVDPSISLRYE